MQHFINTTRFKPKSHLRQQIEIYLRKNMLHLNSISQVLHKQLIDEFSKYYLQLFTNSRLILKYPNLLKYISSSLIAKDTYYTFDKFFTYRDAVKVCTTVLTPRLIKIFSVVENVHETS
jgi:hypothetical protein